MSNSVNNSEVPNTSSGMDMNADLERLTQAVPKYELIDRIFGTSVRSGSNMVGPRPSFRDVADRSAVPSLRTHHHGPQKKVLIIFTGGTIGMEKGPDGVLAPSKGFIKRTLDNIPEIKHEDVPEYEILEWDDPIDSSDFTPDGWVRLAEDIAAYHDSYDGFVILHGTDTMAYTASALSFMLENLSKPVILTGSMIPMEEPVSDAKRNLIVSLMAAAHLHIPEVLLFFNTDLMRGNRSKKTDPWHLAAFQSVNAEPLAKMGVGIKIAKDSALSPTHKSLVVHKKLYSNIIVLLMTPSTNFNHLHLLAKSWKDSSNGDDTEPHEPPALVLLAFGSGNAPVNVKAFKEAIKTCVDAECPVVIMSQCLHGSVDLSQYVGGATLSSNGVIDGKDMTVEACTTKLAFLMGQGLRGKLLKEAMESNLRGELSVLDSVPYSGFDFPMSP